ncbi:CYFA0S19e02058g1_1 [Cyberlindnera fabianii]|uniref:CYFA0S19e02058g1_1 n=1 Tax=Cyberlindnera fabianii TaxID=36022 RepID=A0A061B717_CYBFA|nr:hypothetical protein BON22_0943 [Cyberlindnera fabianii]CDR45707.1 CYFA0S19e02058g1_1 [Cyberlindnera fabianii]
MLRRTLFRSVRNYATVSTTGTTTAATTATPVTATVVPVKRVGAFRGGLLGFFTGVSVTTAVVYFYVLEEYKNSSNVIIKDVVGLTKSIRILEEHVKVLEQKQVDSK